MIEYLLKCHKCNFQQKIDVGGSIGTTEGSLTAVGCQECGKLYTVNVCDPKEYKKLHDRKCTYCNKQIIAYSHEMEKKAQNNEPTDKNHFCPKCKNNTLEFIYLKTRIN